jgi:hypothetical protein
MDVTGDDWEQQKLPSGQKFNTMLDATIRWLVIQEYMIMAQPPWARATLTHKGLTAMNATPTGLKQSIGTALGEATAGGSVGIVGDLIGGIFGGFTKSISGG